MDWCSPTKYGVPSCYSDLTIKIETQDIDEYKIDTLHIHLPYYIDDQNPYYADKTLIPKSITYDEYKENVKFDRELKDYGFKIFIA